MNGKVCNRAIDSDAAFWVAPPSSPTANSSGVDLWRIDLEALGSWKAAHNLLSPDEQRRAGSFRFEKHQKLFRAGRAALRFILGGFYLRQSPSSIVFEYGSHGKPSIPDLQNPRKIEFNLAHSSHLALLGISIARAIGVDLEAKQEIRDAVSRIARFFSPGEQRAFRSLSPDEQPGAFYRAWTRKESYLKARGNGLSIPLADFEVSLTPGLPPRLLRVKGSPDESGRWTLMDVEAGEGFAAAFCVESATGPIRYFEFSASFQPELLAKDI